MKDTILITGHAGFIGFHITKFFLENNFSVIGIDNINDYYSKNLKIERQNILIDIANKNNIDFIYFNNNLKDILNASDKLEKYKISSIIHLAAQAGVRHSISNPRNYFENNVETFFEVLEFARRLNLRLFYASTSSVYGDSSAFPQVEQSDSSHPIQFYAATKKSNEVFAHAYSHIYNLQTIGLRFFTVYGPWGRPDMALYKFCRSFHLDSKITLFNNGSHFRSLTYIDDLVHIFSKIYQKTLSSSDNYIILNIGNPSTISLKEIINILENKFKKTCEIDYVDLQLGDVFRTEVSMNRTSSFIGEPLNFTPNEVGISNFVDWFLTQY